MTDATQALASGAAPIGRVLVVGNCSVDTSYRVPRFPRPGETVIATGMSRDAGGKGANQAVAAARCGVATALCGAVGDDENGRWLRARLADEALTLDGLRDVTLPSDGSIIWVTPDGENRIVSTDAAARSLEVVDVEPALAAMTAGDVLLMQGNLGAALTGALLEAARERGLTTIVNVAPVFADATALLPLVDHAIVNDVEAEQLTGHPDPEAAARAIRDRGADRVVVTIGAGGARATGPEGTDTVPANSIDAVDATGAGDVFCGVYAAWLAARRPVASALRLAVAGATLSVTRPGTQSAFPTRAELDALARGMELP